MIYEKSKQLTEGTSSKIPHPHTVPPQSPHQLPSNTQHGNGTRFEQKVPIPDAYDFFGLTDRLSNSMSCFGTTRYGKRCRWDISETRYSHVRDILSQIEKQGGLDPSGPVNLLWDLASLSLCRDWHQNQAEGIVQGWRKKLEKKLWEEQKHRVESFWTATSDLVGNELEEDLSKKYPGTWFLSQVLLICSAAIEALCLVLYTDELMGRSILYICMIFAYVLVAVPMEGNLEEIKIYYLLTLSVGVVLELPLPTRLVLVWIPTLIIIGGLLFFRIHIFPMLDVYLSTNLWIKSRFPWLLIDNSCSMHYKQSELLHRLFLGRPPIIQSWQERLMTAFKTSHMGRKQRLGPGIKRLQWTCTCGYKAYDDFTEHEPGAAISLANQLLEAGYITHAQISNPQNTPISSFTLYIDNAFVDAKRRLSNFRTPSLPRFSTAGQAANIPMACLPINRCRWLHLCLNKRPYATKMEPLHVCRDEQENNHTDASFFRALRKAYYQHRSWKDKFLFKLSKIEFVEFDLCPEDLVDHIIPDKLPPTIDEYEFQPPPPLKKCPPIGASHMMHLFTSCSSQRLNTSLYFRHIPKRKDRALSFKPGLFDDQTGYGLHFVERINNSLAVTVMFVVSLVVGISFAVGWMVWRADIQGAFGVASYVTSVVTLAVLTWQMWPV